MTKTSSREAERALFWLMIDFSFVVIFLAAIVFMVDGNSEKELSQESVSESNYFLAPLVFDEFDEEEELIHAQDYSPLFCQSFSEDEIEAVAQMVWGEARGIKKRMEQAAVVWCALNRVDAFGGSLFEIVTAPQQFAYNPENPTTDDYGRDLKALVVDVVLRWEREKNGETNVGRVLPKEYLYFGGENGRNWFRTSYDLFDDIWQWTLSDPYVSE